MRLNYLNYISRRDAFNFVNRSSQNAIINTKYNLLLKIRLQSAIIKDENK